MIKRTVFLALYVTLILPAGLFANPVKPSMTPSKGVLCDQYICADKNGVSIDLTKKHLGDTVANAVSSQGSFDVTEFTFANGIFCDIKEKACHINRYFNADGTRSAVDPSYTAQLFGH